MRFVLFTKSFCVINEFLSCYYHLGVISYKFIIVIVLCHKSLSSFCVISFVLLL